MSVRKCRSYDADFKKNAVLLSLTISRRTTIEDGDIRAMAGFRLPPLSIAMNSMPCGLTWFHIFVVGLVAGGATNASVDYFGSFSPKKFNGKKITPAILTKTQKLLAHRSKDRGEYKKIVEKIELQGEENFSSSKLQSIQPSTRYIHKLLQRC